MMSLNDWIEDATARFDECYPEEVLKYSATEEVTPLFSEDPKGPKELVEIKISIIATR